MCLDDVAATRRAIETLLASPRVLVVKASFGVRLCFDTHKHVQVVQVEAHGDDLTRTKRNMVVIPMSPLAGDVAARVVLITPKNWAYAHEGTHTLHSRQTTERESFVDAAITHGQLFATCRNCKTQRCIRLWTPKYDGSRCVSRVASCVRASCVAEDSGSWCARAWKFT